jgi:hypothetical protein
MSRRTAAKKSGGKKANQTPTVRTGSAKRYLPSWRAAIVALVLVGISGAGLAALKRGHDVSHDLSVIGNGIPTVVQIHDPKCQKCQQLKRNVDAAAAGLEDKTQFRIAQIHTGRGRSFAHRHDVAHVTLVLFHGEGKRTRTIEGVTGTDALVDTFQRLAGG